MKVVDFHFDLRSDERRTQFYYFFDKLVSGDCFLHIPQSVFEMIYTDATKVVKLCSNLDFYQKWFFDRGTAKIVVHKSKQCDYVFDVFLTAYFPCRLVDEKGKITEIRLYLG